MSLRARIAARLLPAPAVAPSVPTVASAGLSSTRDDSVANFLTGLGGWGDKTTAAQVDMQRGPLQWIQLDQLWRFNAYAKLVVNLLPAEACRKGWWVEDSTEQVDPFQTEFQRLAVLPLFQEAWTWGRLHGGAVIVMVTDETTPYDLSSPLDLSKVKGIKALQVMSRYEAAPADFDGDITSDNFREVKMWRLAPIVAATQPGANSALTYLLGKEVHHSRVLYFAGERLPPAMRYANGGFDDSVLQATWDPIRNMTVIDQAAAILAQEWSTSVQKIKGLASLTTSDQASTLFTRMTIQQRLRGLTNGLIMDAEDDFALKQIRASGWKEVHESARAALAAASRYPETVLFGQPPGGLNTDGDNHRALMANLVTSGRQQRLRPNLLRLVEVLYAARANTGGGEVPGAYDVKFPAYEEMSDTEIAEMRWRIAQTDQVYMTNGVVSAKVVAASRYGPEGYSTEILPVDPEDVEEVPGKPVPLVGAGSKMGNADAAAPSALVGIYGTGRAGGENHWRLGANAVRLPDDRLPGWAVEHITGPDAGPALTARMGTSAVVEVYQITAPALAALDEYEAPDFTRRTVTLASGLRVGVWFPTGVPAKDQPER